MQKYSISQSVRKTQRIFEKAIVHIILSKKNKGTLKRRNKPSIESGVKESNGAAVFKSDKAAPTKQWS